MRSVHRGQEQVIMASELEMAATLFYFYCGTIFNRLSLAKKLGPKVIKSGVKLVHFGPLQAFQL